MMYALAITGPTASGKTALSLSVAERLSCEIISCDSMQIYRGMDIGTAKATAEERARVPHHLIDVISPSENYSVESYRADAMRAARDITERGRLPLFVGGTGLYIDALMRADSSGVPESDPAFIERILASQSEPGSARELWERLYAVDPESAEKIHENNRKRVLRALEIYERTGKPKSLFDKESREAAPDINIGMITIDFHLRENLYKRVDSRVDLMLSEGLLAEAEGLYRAGLLGADTTAGQAIGYKELVSHIRGESSLEDAAEAIKLASRRYAKRQLTWFRHEEHAVRLYADTESGELRSAEELTEEACRAAADLIMQFKKGL